MYYFLFGSFPAISLAELERSLPGIGGALPKVDRWGAMVDGIDQKHAIELFYRLGGCPRVGFVVREHVTRGQLERTLTELVQEVEGDRIAFGFSVLGSALPMKQAQGIGITIKRRIKEAGRSSRFVVSREPLLSSVVVAKNHLLTKGAEFLITAVSKSEFTIIRTLAVQEFEQWGDRDFGRPARNARRGMLPPKLARVMVNLARPERIILDPFCGSGTILMEALELGYQAIGSDISPEAVADTKKNLQWLAAQRHSGPRAGIQKTNMDDRAGRVFVSDVRHLTRKLPPHSIDAIVTEPDLGLPQSKLLGHESEIQPERKRLQKLYQEALSVFAQLLKNGGIVVMSLPLWRVRSRGSDRVVHAMEPIGLTSSGLFTLVRPPLLYGRYDQFVWREIIMLRTGNA
ncbi:hypothetical protein HZA86_05315 [Candidatus Uhrbacteria bacterium]|nr:hypothetical protein [Candidatus Uhrbacteria bacterium]